VPVLTAKPVVFPTSSANSHWLAAHDRLRWLQELLLPGYSAEVLNRFLSLQWGLPAGLYTPVYLQKIFWNSRSQALFDYRQSFSTWPTEQPHILGLQFYGRTVMQPSSKVFVMCHDGICRSASLTYALLRLSGKAAKKSTALVLKAPPAPSSHATAASRAKSSWLKDKRAGNRVANHSVNSRANRS
jgi:hypothetical protein